MKTTIEIMNLVVNAIAAYRKTHLTNPTLLELSDTDWADAIRASGYDPRKMPNEGTLMGIPAQRNSTLKPGEVAASEGTRRESITMSVEAAQHNPKDDALVSVEVDRHTDYDHVTIRTTMPAGVLPKYASDLHADWVGLLVLLRGKRVGATVVRHNPQQGWAGNE